MRPRIAGVDFSLTSTGLALIDPAGQLYAHRVRPPLAVGNGPDRLEWLLRFILPVVAGADLVVLEAPIHGQSRGSLPLIGGWHVVRHAIWQAGCPAFAEVQNSTLKVYATGYGRSEKPAVLAAVQARYQVAPNSAPVAGHDEADAVVLAAMAAHHYGHPLAPVPETHARALGSVQWPTLPGKQA